MERPLEVRLVGTNDFPVSHREVTGGETYAYPERAHGRSRLPGSRELAGPWAPMSLVGARSQGYRSIQFNAVVETNLAAVHLWQILGFQILATVPEEFDHREHGLVGLHLMFQHLAPRLRNPGLIGAPSFASDLGPPLAVPDRDR
jgi:hypothetical protein